MRESVPTARYSPVCNVLRQWKTSLILTYRVYRLYDTSMRRVMFLLACSIYNNNWEDHFFANLGSSQSFSDSLVQEDPDDEGQFDLEPPPPKITLFQDAISSLEEVQSFLERRGFSEEAITIASSMNKLTYFHCESLNSARQTTLDDYFHPIYLILYYSTHI